MGLTKKKGVSIGCPKCVNFVHSSVSVDVYDSFPQYKINTEDQEFQYCAGMEWWNVVGVVEVQAKFKIPP